MTRGILATCYGQRGKLTTTDCVDAARQFYAGRPFVRVVDKPPHTKWATGSNLVYVSYAADPERGKSSRWARSTTLAKARQGRPCRMRTS